MSEKFLQFCEIFYCDDSIFCSHLQHGRVRNTRHLGWLTVKLSALDLFSTEVEKSSLDLSNFTEWCDDKLEHLAALTFYYQHVRGG